MQQLATNPYRQLIARPHVGTLVAWLGVAALLFAWGLWVSLTNGFALADESWFLLVAMQVAGGDVLYRDVFFGATPLSVYLTAPFLWAFGPEIVAVKAFVALCFTLTALACLAVVRQEGGKSATALLGVALLAYTWPRNPSAYTPLAYACVHGCLVAVLSWQRQLNVSDGRAPGTRRLSRLAAAGALTGMAFCAKQNIGIYLLAALLPIVALPLLRARTGMRDLWRSLGAVGAGFGAVTLVTLLPTVLGGGLAQFIDYGFVNKQTYLKVGGLSYTEEVVRGVKLLRYLNTVEEILPTFMQTSFLLPFPALLATLAAFPLATAEQRRRLLAVTVFAGVALAGVYPRPDIEHFIYAVPALLLCLSYAAVIIAARLPRMLRHAIQLGLVMWLGLGCYAIGGQAWERTISDDFETSTLPHFGLVQLPKHEHARFHAEADELRQAIGTQKAFLLTPHAAFFYLLTDIENPTPFDYPLITAFGLQGRQHVMADIARGSIDTVCMNRQSGSSHSPVDLEEFVAGFMAKERDLRVCTLYRSP